MNGWMYIAAFLPYLCFAGQGQGLAAWDFASFGWHEKEREREGTGGEKGEKREKRGREIDR